MGQLRLAAGKDELREQVDETSAQEDQRGPNGPGEAGNLHMRGVRELLSARQGLGLRVSLEAFRRSSAACLSASTVSHPGSNFSRSERRHILSRRDPERSKAGQDRARSSAAQQLNTTSGLPKLKILEAVQFSPGALRARRLNLLSQRGSGRCKKR